MSDDDPADVATQFTDVACVMLSVRLHGASEVTTLEFTHPPSVERFGCGTDRLSGMFREIVQRSRERRVGIREQARDDACSRRVGMWLRDEVPVDENEVA